MSTYDKIIEYNRNPILSQYFQSKLIELIGFGMYHNRIGEVYDDILDELERYKREHRKSTVVVGVSGGIDSALTAVLFKNAGYRVVGILMPIEQKVEETTRGLEIVEKFNIEHDVIDLTKQYNFIVNDMTQYDPFIAMDSQTDKIRRGNIRARLRMMTLYNLASRYNGFVASTDNFSELAAGFWTLHGDVGDVAPIQSLLKSWEVPAMAEFVGIPDSTIKAVPTDGLGISNSDEDQLGLSYLEFDIAVLSILSGSANVNLEVDDLKKIAMVKERLMKTGFKRNNPYNLAHPLYPERFEQLNQFDRR